jgi:glycosyltransferase involved in cell wall biosynthesis
MNINSAIIYQSPFPPLEGGSGGDRRVKDLTIALSYYSTNTTLIIPEWHKKNSKNISYNEFKIKYIGSFFNNIKFINRLFFWYNLTKWVLNNQYSIVLLYMNTFECIPFIIFLKKYNVKIIFEISDLNTTTSFGLKKFKHLLTENFIPKFSDLNIGISEQIKIHLKKHAPNINSIIIPILADTDSFIYDPKRKNFIIEKHKINSDDIVFIYAGTFWKDEGVKNLILGFDLASKKLNNIKLFIAGKNIKNDNRFDDIEEITKDLISKNNIYELGWISTDDLLSYYCSSDVLAAPQTKSIFNTAALPTKLAEYCLIKKAIIVTNIGDVNKYFINNFNSILLDETDENTISKVILELAKNEELRIKLGENAYLTAIKYFDRKKQGEIIFKNLFYD